MALTAITVLNIPGTTQTIVFNNPTLVDEIDFGSNQITFKAISSYNLSRSDFLLWYNYLSIYSTALLLNFPSLNTTVFQSIPQSEYDLKMGATRLTFDYHSGATDVLNLTYILSNTTMTFGARASDVTVTIQEFALLIYILKQYNQQVSFN